ncbi:hypothetical protein PWT90_00810 [Aphanocladium album]|nr:hypothetical protein PWT90_00810 [Aphanocladium album]
MSSYLVTGSSRGLGLGFTAELLKDKANIVIATARNIAGANELQSLKEKSNNDNFHLVELDVSNKESVDAAAKQVAALLPNGLDNLISSAGISLAPHASWDNLDLETTFREIDFTLKSTIQVIRGFVPLVRKSQAKKILVLTSLFGSIEISQNLPLSPAYSISRAALNMTIRKWSGVLKSDGITTALIHPGYVGSTDLGGEILEWIETYAPNTENLSVEKSASYVIKVLQGLKSEDNGAFFNYDGTKLPW